MNNARRQNTISRNIGRRSFLVTAGAAILGGGCLSQRRPAVQGGGKPANPKPRPESVLSTIPNFCAHEHWGSIGSVGMKGGSFRADAEQGATPNRRTGLVDVLLDPYIGMTLRAAGVNLDEAARSAGAKDINELAARSIVEAMKLLRPIMRPFRTTGTYQCIRRGLLSLHGCDLESADDDVILRLDSSIAECYRDIFGWYGKAMREARFSELIRPVQPEFFVSRQSAETAAAEARFTNTILRIDPLMELWRPKSGRREMWSKTLGIEPVDARSWRGFIGRLFDLAAGNKTTGIKQLQAYSRSLAFKPVADGDVVWRGELTEEQKITFQDWVMHECCKQAHERGWPHQVHVGTHNLPQSCPLPLGDLAARYPRMKLVMIHCWPYLKESGWLAAQYGNIYIDTNSLSLHGAGYFREALAGWLNYVPTHKIMCSHDGTSVEMAAGSALITREILTDVLCSQAKSPGPGKAVLLNVAEDWLQNNSVATYGIGKKTANA